MPLVNFSGIASGIDTEGLIAATSEATRAGRVTPLQNRVQELTDTNDTLSELKNRLNKLKSAAQKFATLNGGALSKQASSSNESILGATSSQAATNGSYQVTVNSKATNGIFTINRSFTATDQVVNATLDATTYPTEADRTLTIRTGQGASQETIDIVLNETSTISTIINDFNTRSTKAVMSAVNIGSPSVPSYKLVVTSLNEGTQLGDFDITQGSALDTTDAFDDGLGTIGTETAATDANIDVVGIGTGIVRASNSISDVIPGVTLNLESLGGPTTITVSDDVAASTSKIQDFVDAWNDVVTFISQNNLVERQESGENVTNIFGPLSKTRVDEGALTALRTKLSEARVTISDEERLIMPDLGLKTERDGTLSFKASDFQTALSTKSGAVNTLLKNFSDAISLTGGTIEQYTGFNRLVDTSMTGNRTQISDLNNRISEIEKQIAVTEAAMRQRFARLESTIGGLQQKQSALSSALSSLPRLT